jgi:hypothetical protein
MGRVSHLPIWLDATRLLVAIEQSVLRYLFLGAVIRAHEDLPSRSTEQPGHE